MYDHSKIAGFRQASDAKTQEDRGKMKRPKEVWPKMQELLRKRIALKDALERDKTPKTRGDAQEQLENRRGAHFRRETEPSVDGRAAQAAIDLMDDAAGTASAASSCLFALLFEPFSFSDGLGVRRQTSVALFYLSQCSIISRGTTSTFIFLVFLNLSSSFSVDPETQEGLSILRHAYGRGFNAACFGLRKAECACGLYALYEPLRPRRQSQSDSGGVRARRQRRGKVDGGRASVLVRRVCCAPAPSPHRPPFPRLPSRRPRPAARAPLALPRVHHAVLPPRLPLPAPPPPHILHIRARDASGFAEMELDGETDATARVHASTPRHTPAPTSCRPPPSFALHTAAPPRHTRSWRHPAYAGGRVPGDSSTCTGGATPDLAGLGGRDVESRAMSWESSRGGVSTREVMGRGESSRECSRRGKSSDRADSELRTHFATRALSAGEAGGPECGSRLPASPTLEQQHLAQLANILYMLAAARARASSALCLAYSTSGAAIPRAHHMQAGPRKWSLTGRKTSRAGSRLRLHACRQLHSHASASRIAGAYLQQQTNASHGARAAEGVMGSGGCGVYLAREDDHHRTTQNPRRRFIPVQEHAREHRKLYDVPSAGFTGVDFGLYAARGAEISLDAYRTYSACGETATSIDHQREKELYVFADDARAVERDAGKGPDKMMETSAGL
ncbi:hypothetical protein B0H17DRAFT_1269913 [Mycena rosella]|uniref:Uncharacterized protein n=1 Tax=Mycena rosella TaxID=1033263 RepID=A0AAD7CLG7_MYCRO|nr:hypothetical protein B0H17DRAFT_1269913 [Mycena rosella]